MSKRQKTCDDIKLISGCGSPAGWGSERCWYLTLKCKWMQDVPANLCCRGASFDNSKDTRSKWMQFYTNAAGSTAKPLKKRRRGRDTEECISDTAFVVCKSGHWGRRMNLPLCLCWAQKQKWIEAEDGTPEDKASQHSNHHILFFFFWFYITEKRQSNWDCIAEAFFYVLRQKRNWHPHSYSKIFQVFQAARCNPECLLWAKFFKHNSDCPANDYVEL